MIILARYRHLQTIHASAVRDGCPVTVRSVTACHISLSSASPGVVAGAGPLPAGPAAADRLLSGLVPAVSGGRAVRVSAATVPGRGRLVSAHRAPRARPAPLDHPQLPAEGAAAPAVGRPPTLATEPRRLQSRRPPADSSGVRPPTLAESARRL